jgi:hypothetical protein
MCDLGGVAMGGDGCAEIADGAIDLFNRRAGKSMNSAVVYYFFALTR